jgi:hypothetical protein
VPARTPKEIIMLLNHEIVKAVALPDVQDRLVALGFEPAAATPESLRPSSRRKFRSGQVLSGPRVSRRIELSRPINRVLGVAGGADSHKH